MKIRVNLSPLGSGLSVEQVIDLYCGKGEQILQWVGFAACSRLAYKRGEAYGRYVPQSVSTKDGTPLDIDIVLSEIAHEGDELFVEYSGGPMPYRVRWEGRPKTPPFKWSDDGEVQMPHDTWLKELNLRQEGVAALVDGDSVGDDSGIDADLADTKKILMKLSGQVQMMFYFMSSEMASTGDQLGQITLPQFRKLMEISKVTTSGFGGDKIDEIFTTVVTSEQALARRVDNKSGISTLDLLDFNIALLHVAYHRAAAVQASQAHMTPLSKKIKDLFTLSFSVYFFPDLSKKLEKFSPAASNPAAQLLLKRGRKLVEQTLDACQLKRVKSSAVKVGLRWLSEHLKRWNLLYRDFNLQELVLAAIFAKQIVSDAEKFKLHPQPLEYDYNEFEKLLLGIAWHVYQIKKKGDVTFEEFLGEMLDSIFKRAGVLVEAEQEE